MAATTDQLQNDAKCIFDCVPGAEMKLSILISLFAQIANVSADPSVLMANAKQIFCCVPGIDMKLSILIDLFQSGSSSASGNVTCGLGAPTSTPSSGCGIYIQIDSGPLPGAYWSYYSGAWHQV